MHSHAVTIAPISSRTRVDGVPCELGPGVRLVARPSWLTPQFLRSLGEVDRREIALSRLLIEVTHEELDGHYACIRLPCEERAIQLAHFLGLAAWIAKPCALGFTHAFHVRIDSNAGAHLFQYSRRNEYLAHPSESPARVTRPELDRAKSLFATLTELQRRGSVWGAVRTLSTALRMSEWEQRFLLFWIVLEALFGPDEPRQTTERLATRMSMFFRAEGKDRGDLRRRLKRSYQLRSKIVHGKSINPRKLSPERSQASLMEIELLVCEGLGRILSTPELLDQFGGPGREQYLKHLASE